MQALEGFNWIDILLILSLIRAAYTGARLGLTAELFKLLGVLLSIVLGFHYFNQIANALVSYINMPIWIAQFIILLVIVLSLGAIFKYCIVLLLKVLNIQFVLQLERIGGALIGLVRGFLVGGLVLIALLLFPAEYLYTSFWEKSLLAPYFIKATKKTYTSIIGFIPSQQPKNILMAPPAKKGKPGSK